MLRPARTSQLLLALLIAAPAYGQTTLTFGPVCDAGYVQYKGDLSYSPATGYHTTYEESGFRLYTNAESFGSWCRDTYHFAGQGMFANNVGADNVLTRIDGGTFSIQSIDLAQLYYGAWPAGDLTFVGHTADGSSVSQTFLLGKGAYPDQNTFSTFEFDPAFTNLESVDFELQKPSYPWYQFANVKLDGDVVATPEPSSVLMLVTGLLVLGGLGLRGPRRAGVRTTFGASSSPH